MIRHIWECTIIRDNVTVPLDLQRTNRVLMVGTWKSGEAGRRGNRLHVTLSARFYQVERSQWSSLSFGLYGTISVSTFEPTRNINRRRAVASAELTDTFFILFAFIPGKFIRQTIANEWPIEARKITTQSFEQNLGYWKKHRENNCHTLLSLFLFQYSTDSFNNKREFVKHITKREFKNLLLI